uniref:Uncharacterized protein n=1 Tax=Canis lupus familiaris TaxID=9615 RepID=A0A8C0RN27_CANLF
PVLQLPDTRAPMPLARQVPASPARPKPPSTLCHSCQTPDFQGDPWPTQASLHPVPIFPWLPPVPHASLVTPRLPRFPSFPNGILHTPALASCRQGLALSPHVPLPSGGSRRVPSGQTTHTATRPDRAGSALCSQWEFWRGDPDAGAGLGAPLCHHHG